MWFFQDCVYYKLVQLWCTHGGGSKEQANWNKTATLLLSVIIRRCTPSIRGIAKNRVILRGPKEFSMLESIEISEQLVVQVSPKYAANVAISFIYFPLNYYRGSRVYLFYQFTAECRS